jgi:predicted regulator of Ras-like GTPase activity (Roadblock/LC7/MglB family)
MPLSRKNSTDVLKELKEIPGVDAVVVSGRDGFVIESAGSTDDLNIDALGASLAHAINSIEEMGRELEVDGYRDIFIEYGKAVIMCRPVGDAIAALVSPDASKLGIIRHKAKNLFAELSELF